MIFDVYCIPVPHTVVRAVSMDRISGCERILPVTQQSDLSCAVPCPMMSIEPFIGLGCLHDLASQKICNVKLAARRWPCLYANGNQSAPTQKTLQKLLRSPHGLLGRDYSVGGWAVMTAPPCQRQLLASSVSARCRTPSIVARCARYTSLFEG
jgi:hypothetical protein